MNAVTSTQHIQVSAPALWAAITSDRHLEACHPYIQKHTKNTSTSGLSDVITYLNGVTFTRESTAWMDGVGYDLKVGKASEPKNEVAWRIEAVSPTSCKLSISVTPAAGDDEDGRHPVGADRRRASLGEHGRQGPLRRNNRSYRVRKRRFWLFWLAAQPQDVVSSRRVVQSCLPRLSAMQGDLRVA